MNITILRSYHPNGTNGRLYINGVFQCYTIELPWLDNSPRVSCIPEGIYILRKRYSRRHAHHFLVTGVPARALILIHPANNALRELKGCIAPVTTLLPLPGQGANSRRAMAGISALLLPAQGKKRSFYSLLKKMKMNTKDKAAKPKKPLLQKLKTIGLIMAGVGAAIIAAPVTLPAIVITVGGYVAVAGGILVAAAQPVSAKLKSLFV